ncbi:MAG: helix-turn-helix transcriptional regulator [Lachnospiraceae bacterium]|nr:helix-turn-helix transcriptional regulator [Lachnospiraceae bacterium]
MILADKIMEERKRGGWSQEELAEKLGVSRQSVSKWESAQSVPDLNRILQMAELFGVTTDYLLKDEMESKENQTIVDNATELAGKARSVSMEEASEFLQIQKKNAPLVAWATSLCVMSPIALIVLSGFADERIFGISENMAGGIGMIVLLVLVAIGVAIFIKTSSQVKKFEFLEKANIDTAYGVDGMVREKKNAFAQKYSLGITLGVVLCILSIVPLMASAFLFDKDYIYVSMVGVLLFMIAIAVNLFVRVGVVQASFDKLLQEGDYTVSKKKSEPIMSRIATIYWLLAVAIYLGWSFLSNAWHITWVVWPIAGVLYGVVVAIVNLATKTED